MAEVKITNDKTLASVTEAMSAYLLYPGGRLNALMPTAQFNQLENLDKPPMATSTEDSIREVWDRRSGERDGLCRGRAR